MSDIFSLLNISSETFQDFPLQAILVTDHQTEKMINSNMRRLKQIESMMLSDKQIQVSTQSIEEVIHKVRKAVKTSAMEIKWSVYELRIVSYYMVKLQNDSEAFTYALLTLENNWRNLFFNGLIFYIMNAWNSMPKKCREDTCKLITSQLNKYQDKNKRYLMLKNHANFFEENGPLRVASLIENINEDLSNAPILIGYKPSTFSLSYYSDVIINYFKKKSTDDLSLIEDVLTKHTLNRTKKLLVANLVEEADQNRTELRQTQISKFASRVLGDISLSSTWAPFNNATPEEEEKLRHARELVNKWYARKVIEVFFDVCVQDPDRKTFWLRYINYITNFRIAGSSAVKFSLNADYRISEMFHYYFVETNSRKNKTAALILYIRDKVFVEFSDLGSLYIYNKDNSTIKTLINKKYIDSINDLKDTFLPQAVDASEYGYFYFSQEGNMRHAGKWQYRLDYWFRQILNINV